MSLAELLTISVVIPAYNSAPYIARAIESVLTQTSPAEEIIVVDDGSSDNTADVVHSYESRIIYIRQGNAGVSVARNTGIETATSDWVAFLDADDEWVPDKLKLQREHLARNPHLVWTMSNYICCKCAEGHQQHVYDQGRSEPVLAGKEFYTDYFDAFCRSVCGNTNTMLIKKAVLYEAGLFRAGQPRMNDEDMWFRIAYRYPPIGYVGTPLAIYHRQVAGSIVKTHNHPEIVIELLKRHLALAQEHGRYDAFRPVARSITKMWIHWSWEDQRVYQIRMLLEHLGFLLPRWYRAAVYVLTIFPGLTLQCMPVLRKVNKVFKVRL